MGSGGFVALDRGIGDFKAQRLGTTDASLVEVGCQWRCHVAQRTLAVCDSYSAIQMGDVTAFCKPELR